MSIKSGGRRPSLLELRRLLSNTGAGIALELQARPLQSFAPASSARNFGGTPPRFTIWLQLSTGPEAVV